MPTILVTFSDDKGRDKFIESVKKFNPNFDKQIKYDPVVLAETELAALFINNEKIVEGPLAVINQQFNNEINNHKLQTTIKKLVDGAWVPIRSRIA